MGKFLDSSKNSQKLRKVFDAKSRCCEQQIDDDDSIYVSNGEDTVAFCSKHKHVFFVGNLKHLHYEKWEAEWMIKGVVDD